MRYMIKNMDTKGKATPSALQRKICWMALTLLCLSFIITLACGFAYGMVKLFAMFEAVLLPVLIAGLMAYLLNPLVTWVQRYVVRRIWAVLIVMAGAFLLVLGLGMCIVPPLVQQSKELYANRSYIVNNVVTTTKKLLDEDPAVQKTVDILYKHAGGDPAAPAPEEQATPGSPEDSPAAPLPYDKKLGHVLSHHSDYLVDKGIDWLTAGGRVLFGTVYVLIGVVIVPVFLFYFLLESEPIAKNWDKLLPLRNSYLKDEIVATLKEINENLVAFVRGQMLVSLIDAVILGIALSCMGLPYALTISAAVAVLGIIPYIGMISTSIPAMLVAWFTWYDWSSVIAVAAIFLTVSQLDGWLLQPKIVGKKMKMHDLTVMFSVLFWSLVFGGVLGALIAVPLTASIKVIFKRYVWVALTEQHSAQKSPILPSSPPDTSEISPKFEEK